MAPLRVKFLARTAADQDPALWLSLLPRRAPEHEGVAFSFDIEDRNYDWLVVYEDLPYPVGSKRSTRIENLACSPENTLFITTEPSSIKIYGPQYLRQFGHVLSVQHEGVLGHPNQIEKTPPLRWYYGRPFEPGRPYLDWDALSAMDPMQKTDAASTVCSSKQMSPVFRQRYDFTRVLKDGLGDDLHWFGRGVRPMSDKADAMDSYRYHVAIENHIQPDHWTEKIADCFLAFCLPLYYGPPNIGDVFPSDSIVPIDINKPAEAIENIQKLIHDRAYEQRLPAIKEARRRVLNQHNLMFVIADIVKERHDPLSAKASRHVLGRHIFRSNHPFKAARDQIHRLRHASKK